MVVVKDLPPPLDMSCPKFEAVAERVLRETQCGHIVFVQYTAAHYWLRELLVRRGVSRERIAIINGEVKADLTSIAKKFNGTDEKDPEYDVIIANSTAYRGANLQRRTCAIHNLDLTFTPAEIEQRRGRGDRFGNTLDLIRIWFYFTQGSYDSFLFDLLAGKANWHDKLYHSEDDRTTNPAKQLDLDESQMLAMTAETPEEQAEFAAALRAQAAREELEEAHRNAVRAMTQAAGRYRSARHTRDPEVRRKLEQEAQGRLRVLAAASDEVWPWKRIQDVVREQDVLVYDTVELIPVFSGLLFEVTGKRYQVGRASFHEKTFGLREFGSVKWSFEQKPPRAAHVVPADEWDVSTDRELTVKELEGLLRDGVTWSALGWRDANQAWLEPMWDDFGTRILLALPGDFVVPVHDNGARLVRVAELKGVLERVIPPTFRGWSIFVGLVELSTTPLAEFERVAETWWRRGLPDLRGRGRVRCPAVVERLRPPVIMRQIEERHRTIKPRQRKVAVTLEDIDGDSQTYNVKLPTGHTVDTLAIEAIRAIYSRYLDRVAQLSKAILAASSEEPSEETWLRLASLRTERVDAQEALVKLVGSEAAATIDQCASKAAGLEITLDDIIERTFRPHMQGEWWAASETKRLMRRDLKRELRARGLDNGDDVVKEALERYVARAQGEKAKHAASKKKSTRKTSTKTAKSGASVTASDDEWTWSEDTGILDGPSGGQYIVQPHPGGGWFALLERTRDENAYQYRIGDRVYANKDDAVRVVLEHRAAVAAGREPPPTKPLFTEAEPEPAPELKSPRAAGKRKATRRGGSKAKRVAVLLPDPPEDVERLSHRPWSAITWVTVDLDSPYTQRMVPTRRDTPRDGGGPPIAGVWVIKQGDHVFLRPFREGQDAVETFLFVQAGHYERTVRAITSPDEAVNGESLSDDLEILDRELHERQFKHAESVLLDLEWALGSDIFEALQHVREQKTDSTYTLIDDRKAPKKLQQAWWVNKSPWRETDFEGKSDTWRVGGVLTQLESFDAQAKSAKFEGRDEVHELPGSDPEIMVAATENAVPEPIVSFEALVQNAAGDRRQAGEAKNLPGPATTVIDSIAGLDVGLVLRVGSIAIHHVSEREYRLERDDGSYHVLMQRSARFKRKTSKAHPGVWCVLAYVSADGAVTSVVKLIRGCPIVTDPTVHREQTRSVADLLADVKDDAGDMKKLRAHVSGLEAVESRFMPEHELRDQQLLSYLNGIEANETKGVPDAIRAKFKELGFVGRGTFADLTYRYRSLWSHPALEKVNRGVGPLAYHFFHVYGAITNTAEHEYILVMGRMGATHSIGYTKPHKPKQTSMSVKAPSKTMMAVDSLVAELAAFSGRYGGTHVVV